ncbi:hypothetical protein [Novacetimonas hansenii]|nr:hypothetical protein [Novacetimonas hansenii]
MKKESFRGPHFDRKRRRLLKLFRKSFTKKLYDFSMLHVGTQASGDGCA